MECEAFVRELQDAWQADHKNIQSRFQEVAQSSGRNPETFRLQWVMSLAQMPDDEFQSMERAHYPGVAEVRRKWKDHEERTGHSVVVNGWRGAFLKGSGR